MSVLVIAVLLGLIPAFIAKNKGRSFGTWWLYGALLFIVAIIHVLLISPSQEGLANNQAREGLRDCPFCAEPIKFQALKCKHCGSEVEPVLVSSSVIVSPQSKYTGTQVAWKRVGILVAIVVIVMAFMHFSGHA
ncbi:zinc ribbon domain-containing protein [Paramixta manurensis]|uniref:zinc ribbon domain-containing protein n=1 Tax=Paramixta manurensis TaxID=2740817 RepID=UPI00156AD915